MASSEEKFREEVRRSGATRTFDLYEDPGHSWLKVPKSAIRGVGIADKITPYSYQRGEFAYLEEDVDAPLFIQEIERQYGVTVKLREHATDNDSKIRNYDQYNPADGGADSLPEGWYKTHQEIVIPSMKMAIVERELSEGQMRSCPTCGGAMPLIGDRYTCVNCGATMGEYRPREPMRRPEVRVRGHERRSK